MIKHNNNNIIITTTMHPYTNSFLMHNTVRYTAKGATDVVSSTDDYSYSTCSYTGDSGFSDSRAYLKESPPSSPQRTYYQGEQGSDITADVSTGYYKSLNPESRIPGRCFLIGVIYYLHDNIYYHITEVIYDHASGQPSTEN